MYAAHYFLIPLLVVSSSSATLLSPRGRDEVWGGVNITQAELEVAGAISKTCNTTSYCIDLATKVIPQCLGLQGSAGCWCTLHDPLHYCALCMSNPTDNTTSATQTQQAVDGHTNYHKGCGAYQAYLTASSSAPSTASPTASATSASDSKPSSSLGTGALVGIIVGGVVGVVLIIAGAFLIWRKMGQNPTPNNSHNNNANVLAPGYFPSVGTPYQEVKRPYSSFGPNSSPPPPPHMGYSPMATPMSAPLTPEMTGQAQFYDPRQSTAYNQHAPTHYAAPAPVNARPITAQSQDSAGNHAGSSNPAGFQSPPPPFVANSNHLSDYDTSMLGLAQSSNAAAPRYH
ncbi:hypothetical protein BOTBODRAFT_141497 [Botryobasidium botryosum FD-172 SS1]|uniref:Extracellular membrane protein CFEM domain-containing protein n=1 Tax=Botryobasidium botryosum (strain FD-172 SS1) TaxID=930990 RepID=A0A067N2G5_BOTB1|nr:hypothetical protein BOTBODRAFT_141497 [Botryobasidium botryosum FD-172 SS1]